MAQTLPASAALAHCSDGAHQRWAVVATRVAAHLDELALDEIALLRLCDGLRNLDAICRYTGLDPAEAARTLADLEERGFVVTSREAAGPAAAPAAVLAWVAGEPGEHTPAAESAFSDEEEAFFAAGEALADGPEEYEV